MVISESMRFPELGRAFYDNGPAACSARRSATGSPSRPRRAGLPCPIPAMAADQFVGMLRGGLYLRATLGLTPPTEAEIDAAVASAVAAFVRAYAPG